MARGSRNRPPRYGPRPVKQTLRNAYFRPTLAPRSSSSLSQWSVLSSIPCQILSEMGRKSVGKRQDRERWVRLTGGRHHCRAGDKQVLYAVNTAIFINYTVLGTIGHP